MYLTQRHSLFAWAGINALSSFAEKDLEWHGFAAGCVAVAVPRRRPAALIGLHPWCGLGPSVLHADLSADLNAANLWSARTATSSISWSEEEDHATRYPRGQARTRGTAR